MANLRTPPAGSASTSARRARSDTPTGLLGVRDDALGARLLTPAGVPLVDRRRAVRSSRAAALEQLLVRDRPLPGPARMPARTVHGRGIVAQGSFECHAALDEFTQVRPFMRQGKRTPVTVFFGSAVGERSSADTVRDARSFAVRFHTEDGPWDLLDSSLPVAPVADAAALAELLTATRAAPGQPTPHDAFWDFVGRRSEAMHHTLWLMSASGLPRSYRTMPGYGIDTWRLNGHEGEPVYARFHWVPLAGAHGLLWDEAVKIAAADPDFHRRDFIEAIDSGDLPEYELAVQIVDDAAAARLPFDIGDPTHIVPEDVAPLRSIGRLVLDRYRDEPLNEHDGPPFASTHLVPGIEAVPPAAHKRHAEDADYVQPRRFWRSLDSAAQHQLADTLHVELARVGGEGIRERVIARLANVDFELAAQLADALNVELPVAPPPPERGAALPLLSLHRRGSERSIASRRIALLVCEGCDAEPLRALHAALTAAGAVPRYVGQRLGSVRCSDGSQLECEITIGTAPSVLWDAAALPGGPGAPALYHAAPVLEFVRDQYRHAKPIALLGEAELALTAAYLPTVLRDGSADPGLLTLPQGDDAAALAQQFVAMVERHRHFERLAEPPIV